MRACPDAHFFARLRRADTRCVLARASLSYALSLSLSRANARMLQCAPQVSEACGLQRFCRAGVHAYRMLRVRAHAPTECVPFIFPLALAEAVVAEWVVASGVSR